MRKVALLPGCLVKWTAVNQSWVLLYHKDHGKRNLRIEDYKVKAVLGGDKGIAQCKVVALGCGNWYNVQD